VKKEMRAVKASCETLLSKIEEIEASTAKMQSEDWEKIKAYAEKEIAGYNEIVAKVKK